MSRYITLKVTKHIQKLVHGVLLISNCRQLIILFTKYRNAFNEISYYALLCYIQILLIIIKILNIVFKI